VDAPVLRDARPDEIDALVRFHREVRTLAYASLLPREVIDRKSPDLRREEWREVLGGRGCFALVLEEGGAVAAVATAGPAKEEFPRHTAMVRQLYVRADRRGRGWGGRLLREMAGRLRAAGHAGLYLRTPGPNAPARRFYERRGGLLLREDHSFHGPFPVVRVAYGWTDLRGLARG
jgi:GNAT superfamily N-acetyltransferase